MENQDLEVGLTAECESILGDRTPRIGFVRNATTNSSDTYTPGGVLEITGENLDINVWGDPTLGAYFIDSTGAENQSASYVVVPKGDNSFLVVPKELVGPQKLKLKAAVDGNTLWAAYHIPLVKEES